MKKEIQILRIVCPILFVVIYLVMITGDGLRQTVEAAEPSAPFAAAFSETLESATTFPTGTWANESGSTNDQRSNELPKRMIF